MGRIIVAVLHDFHDGKMLADGFYSFVEEFAARMMIS
jgi:hypothetical protein